MLKTGVGGRLKGVLALLAAAVFVVFSAAAPAQAANNYSLMAPNYIPQSIGGNAGLELGVTVQTSATVYLTEVKFFKFAQDTTVHEAHVWDSNGVLLATAPLITETASGWQTLPLTTALQFSAGDTFVVSVFALDYYYPSGSFPNQTVGPLTVQGTGLYRYGNQSGFPTQTVGTNYAVDMTVTDTNPASSGGGSQLSSSGSNQSVSLSAALASTGSDGVGTLTKASIAALLGLAGLGAVLIAHHLRRRKL